MDGVDSSEYRATAFIVSEVPRDGIVSDDEDLDDGAGRGNEGDLTSDDDVYEYGSSSESGSDLDDSDDDSWFCKLSKGMLCHLHSLVFVLNMNNKCIYT